MELNSILERGKSCEEKGSEWSRDRKRGSVDICKGEVKKVTRKPGSDKGKFNTFYSIIISSDESFEQAGAPSEDKLLVFCVSLILTPPFQLS